jgi:nucleoside-diphosphate-sugar epimerase
MTAKKVLVYGATGTIGTNLIQIISKKQPEWTVLAATRSGGAGSYLAALNLKNVEMIQSDIENLEDARTLTTDVDLVFCCVGFLQYQVKYWATHWPVVVENLLQVTSSARPLIFCDNIYAYGPTTNISTATKTVAPSLKSKPGIRATLRQSFENRMKSDPMSIAVVGGAEFFGPRNEGKTFLGDPFLGNMVEGKKPMAMGSDTCKHDYCYAPDFAYALYLVAAETAIDRDSETAKPKTSMGRFWICPHSVKNQTARELATRAHEILGTKDKGVQVLPVSMIKVLGIFLSFMREMKEMMPFWTSDYTVDDSEFCSAFDVEATPIDTAFRETIDYYKNKAKKQT